MVDEKGREVSMLEDVYYPNEKCNEKRVFYVDVGNLPKRKAEDYLKSLIKKYRNK